MKIRTWVLLGFLALVQPQILSAAGLILVHEPDFWREPPRRIVPPEVMPPPRPHPPFVPPPQPVWAPLETRLTKAEVRIKDQWATTALEQEFYNPNPRPLEGTFLFPVPKGAQINKITMEINGKPVDAELLSAEKAKGIYEDIVRKLRDPALLEYAGRDLIKVRIFPIEPHSPKRIALSYAQLLKLDGGLVSYTLPLNTERYSAKPINTVSVKVEVETARPLKSIYSPSHKVEIQRKGGNRASIGYEATAARPDTDFQLLFSQERQDLGLNLLTYRLTDDEGYFLLLASPGIETKRTRVMPKDVAFVIDTSGSMAGPKLEQAKKALLFCVENLNAEDRFEILRFATEVEPLFQRLGEASEDRRKQARAFIQDLKPLGGTAIDDALKQALAMRPPKGDRPYLVIFLTDGRPTVGNTDEKEIVARVTRSGEGNVRVFCFGIGTDVNTHLLDRIGEETRAFSQYVLAEEDLEVKVSSFFSKIKEPLLASPKVVFPDSIRATKLYPAPLPDIFKGEQVVLAGRYSGHGQGAVQIEGLVEGETKRFAEDVTFPERATEHDFIARLWATRRVGYLLDEIRLRGENKELKDEVVELARRYNIVTPYTSYLIVEDEGRRGLAMGQRTVQLQNETQRRQIQGAYSNLMQDRGGSLGVASARSYFQLKSADAPAEAIVAGNAELMRSAPLAAPQLFVQSGVASAPSSPAAVDAAARQYTQQSRFLGGKSFFQNGAQWMDASVQQAQNVKPVRVQFASAEYFALLAKHPEAASWLSLGRNVQFVLAGAVYEVYE